MPEGFTYSIKDEDVAETLTTPFVVRAHEKLLLTVTMDASVLGSRSGDIVVTPADGQGTAITLPSAVRLSTRRNFMLRLPTVNSRQALT